MIYSSPRTRFYEHKVQNGLSVTPIMMAEAVAAGRPISSQSMSIPLNDDKLGSDFVPREFCRGVDINDLWSDVQSFNVKKKEVTKLYHKHLNETSETVKE